MRPFVLGRSVIAVVLSEAQSRSVSACFAFNPDARPFVPARLRTLFDTPTPRFCAHAALGAVPGAWLHASSTVVLPSSGELDECAHEATRAAFCSLARMLRLEEAAQTRALRAYDCFDAVLDAYDISTALIAVAGTKAAAYVFRAAARKRGSISALPCVCLKQGLPATRTQEERRLVTRMCHTRRAHRWLTCVAADLRFSAAARRRTSASNVPAHPQSHQRSAGYAAASTRRVQPSTPDAPAP
jgi:hypothetical protein